MSERTAIDIADALEVEMPTLKNMDDAAAMLRQQHAEIERLKTLFDPAAHAHRPDCCGPQIDTHCTGCTMTDLTALEIAGNLETFGQGWIDAVDMHHAEIGRLRDGLSVIANGRCADVGADVYADRVLMGLKMKLTERELWLMRRAFNDGVCDENFDAWLNDGAADGVTVADVLAVNAPPETVVEEFLRRTGQYVTNDASREAAIAAAVAAEREACAAVCEAISTGLSAYRDGYGASACLEAIRARSSK